MPSSKFFNSKPKTTTFLSSSFIWQQPWNWQKVCPVDVFCRELWVQATSIVHLHVLHYPHYNDTNAFANRQSFPLTCHTIFLHSFPQTPSLSVSLIHAIKLWMISKTCLLTGIADESWSFPPTPHHCMFLGHIPRHKTNVLSSVNYDESLHLCQLTSSYSIPLPSYCTLHALIYPPPSSTLLLTDWFIHSFSLYPCPSALNFSRGMRFESQAGRQTGGEKN